MQKNGVFFSILCFFISFNVLSDFAYKVNGCNAYQEFFNVNIDTRKNSLAISSIYGPGTDEDSQIFTLFNPFSISKIAGNKIYAESTFDKVVETTGIYSGPFYEGSKDILFSIVVDLDAKSSVLSIKISNNLSSYNVSNVRTVLKEFNLISNNVRRGAIIDGPHVYSGCRVNIERDYEKEEKLEEEKREKREIEKQLIELEKIKAEAELRKQIEDQIEPSIIGSGTGFIINDEGYVITNFHVISKCEYVRNGNENLQIVASDPVNDISVLKSNRDVSNKIDLSSNSVIKGEDIFVIGYPFGTFLSGGLMPQSKTTKGIVSSLQGPNNFYNWFQMDAAIQPGNSGGPIIDTRGGLKGVTVASADYKVIFQEFEEFPENINFGVKVDIVKNILDANEINYEVKEEEGFLDFLFADTTEEIIKNSDKSTLYLECWAKNIPQE